MTDSALIQVSPHHLSDFNEGNSLAATLCPMAETEAREVVVDFVQRATDMCRNKQYEEGLLLWKKSVYLFSLRFRKDELTAKANFELGKLLFEHWERDSEAEEALRRSWESGLNPVSEQGVAVANTLGRVLIQNLKLNDALQLLKKAVEIGKQRYPDSENTQTSLCYLSLALWKTNEEQAAAQLITKCRLQGSQNRPTATSTALAFWLSGDFALICEQFSEAEGYYHTALRIFKTLDSNFRDMAIVYITLGTMYRNSERWTRAESIYLEALKTFRDDPIIRRSLLLQVGAFYETSKRYSEAQVSYREALQLYQQYDPKSTNRANALIQVGALHLKTCGYSDAEYFFKEALEIVNTCDPKSPYTGDIHVMLASLYEMLHRYPEAEQRYQTALEAYGKQTHAALEVNKVRKQLESLYEKMQTDPAAERLLIETLELYKDPTSIQAAHLLSLLGKVSQEKRKFQDAEHRYQAALAIFKSNDPTSTRTSTVLSLLANLYQVQEHTADAIQIYEAALLIAQTSDPMSIDTGNILLQLASLEETEKRYSAAEEKVAGALEIFQMNNARPQSTGKALLLLGSLCAETDRLKAAQWHLKAALALFTDPTNRRCALVKLGSIYDQLRLYRSAYQTYQEALTLYQQYDPRAVEVIQLRVTQGKLSVRMNRLIKAEEHYNAALDLYRAENPTSEDTATCFLSLAAVYLLRHSSEVYSGFNLPPIESKLLEDTEKSYMQAYKIYRAHESTSVLAGNVLLKLCSLYEILGIKHEAERLYRNAFEIYRVRDPISASTVLRKLGMICEDKQQYEDTEKLLKEAWELSKSLSSNPTDCLEELAHFYERRQDFVKAKESYTEALEIQIAHDPNSLSTGSILLQIGKLYEKMQSLENDALNAYTDALRICRAHDPTSLATGSVLLQMAKICGKMQLESQAESAYNEALRIYQEDDPVSNDSYVLIEALGDFYEEKKRYQDAEELYTDTVHRFKDENPMGNGAAKAIVRLASLYAKSEKYGLSHSCYVEALSIYSVREALCQDTANVLLQLGSLSIKFKLYSTAERQLISALDIQHISNCVTSQVLLVLGNLYTEVETHFKLNPEHRWKVLFKAKHCYLDLARIWKAEDPNAPAYGNLLMHIIAMDVGSYDFRGQDLTVYEDAVSYLKTNNPLSTEIEGLLSKLGMRYENMKVIKKAQQCYEEAFQRRLSNVARPEDAQDYLTNLVQFYQRNDLFALAEQASIEALDRYRSFHSPPKFIGQVLIDLGYVCKQQNRLEDAEARYLEALEICKADDPMSEFTGKALFRLGKLMINSVSRSEQLLVSSFDIYIRCNPAPYDIIDLLKTLDSLLRRTSRFSESEQIYKQALLACENSKPRSKLEGDEMRKVLADRYLRERRYTEAEKIVVPGVSISRDDFYLSNSSFVNKIRACYYRPEDFRSQREIRSFSRRR